jgi:hypothetical protein
LSMLEGAISYLNEADDVGLGTPFIK